MEALRNADWELIGIYLLNFSIIALLTFWTCFYLWAWHMMGERPDVVRRRQRKLDREHKRAELEFKELEKVLYERPEDWIREGERRAEREK